MLLLRALLRDRRVWLVAVLAVFAIVFSRFCLGSEAAVKVVVKGGYWVVLPIVVYFGYTIVRLVRPAWATWRPWRTHGAVLGLVAVCSAVLLAQERYGFKILADELLLLGTSENLHYERHAAYPVRATNVQGPYQIIDSLIDKRPILFPFLVSLVHDFTGYRPENPFYVNTLLGVLFLFLAYALGAKIGRSRWAGALLVLLFAGLPLYAQQMKGGGFDLLNLVVLAAVLWLAMAFAERRDTATAEAFCYAGVLLAFTRYESILMLLPLVGVFFWAWWREGRVILTWPMMITPLLLIVPLLHNRVFTVNTGAWEMGSRDASVPFALHYVAGNFTHDLNFFFDTTGYQPNSPFFAGLGLIAAVFFALWIVRVLRRPGESAPADVATACIGIGLFGIWALLLGYFWGQFDDPVIHRLSLPVHLLMAVAVAASGALVIRSARWWQGACAAAVVALVVFSLPSMSRRAYAATYSPAAEMEWREDFLRRFPSRDYLFIDNDSVFWITHQIAATANTQARLREEGLVYHLRNDSFSAIYVMQHYRVDDKTGAWTMEPTDDIGPDFELVPVWEKRIQTLFIGRISRVTAIRYQGTVTRAGPIATPMASRPLPTSADGWDAAKEKYVDKWLKQLP